MNGRGRRAARVAAAAAAVGLLMPAGRALADGIEPSPTAWPTVKVAEQGEANEPKAVAWPTVPAADNQGEPNEPKPVAWPTVKAEN